MMSMGLFKSEEEKLKQKQNEIKKFENGILKFRECHGKVGATHTGWNFSDGFRNADKVKFKSTKFKIYDDKLMIERKKLIIEYSKIKEIFQENENEAIIILNNDTGIPIKKGIFKSEFLAFINILNRLIQENKSNNNSNSKNDINSEDKFDKLIKLGEMHDKGLLSDEEFDSLKKELLSGNNEDTSEISEDNCETSVITCENCGATISPEDIYCSECGIKK